MKRAGAVVVGLVLASLPFLLYGSRGHVHAPHTDHAPRHGGELFMVGDHHVEVVSVGNTVELYLSDGSRRPLRAAGGSVVLSSGDAVPMRWSDQRLVAELTSAVRAERYLVMTSDGDTLSLEAR